MTRQCKIIIIVIIIKLRSITKLINTNILPHYLPTIENFMELHICRSPAAVAVTKIIRKEFNKNTGTKRLYNN